MNRLSICVITLNEAHDLPRLLKSAEGVAEEVVVVDSGSTDATMEIARSAGACVLTRAWTNYAEQKNFAAAQASEDWILLLDADEELSGELRESILKWKAAPPEFPVYEIARLAWFLGAWIHHSRWYPDWQRRLYDRRKAHFSGAIHESLRFQGSVGRMQGNLLHYTVRNLQEQRQKSEEYSTVSARAMFESGRREWRAAKWFATPWTWFRYFVLGAGFLDGYRGFLIARSAAHTVWLKYTKLGGLIQQASREKQ
ncbi:MAG TPA: glycosyltransferase family 2 protein [Candidatus Acidoferrum sp.]|jgi:glycosyltransferase involved in cell wall biosynthesis|nr:glycosyltransferase family 2 protein [Candidatus Acidoferrum sp.]